jgi:anthranilate phosphoribosyltransferase
MRVAEALELLRVRSLDRNEATRLFRAIVAGELGEVEIAAVLAALKTRGETPVEIAGAADALRESALPFPVPDYPYADTCGTGGDGVGSLNISTAVAFVAAEMGVPVAKHGNRSVSSRCGSADVLEALGARLDAPPEVSRRCLDEVGICFLLAPQYHPGVRHAMPVRRALATRTIFNLLGPLANPARPPWQLMGVYDPRLVAPLAETLGLLGAKAALVVHGSGHDELVLHGSSTVARWKDGRLDTMMLTPARAGVAEAPADALLGGEPAENAAWLRDVLTGRATPAQVDAVALNTGALLWLADRFPTLPEAVGAARTVIQSGAPRLRLNRFIELSHGT